MASAALRPPGSVNAGLTPGPSSSTSISPTAIACTSFATSAYGVALPYAQSEPKRTVLPTLPSAALRSETAYCTRVASGPLAAAPPAMTRLGLPWASALASPTRVS